MQKKTLVIGASSNKSRYSNRAVQMLLNKGFEVVPLGIRKGNIYGLEIISGFPKTENIHTVTMYIGKHRQIEYFDYLISINPKRVIFNPGSENPELEDILKGKNIEVIHDCTLVMLSNGNY